MKELAIKAVFAAARVLRDNFGREQQVHCKDGSGSIATDMDLESERIIVDLITASFPDHDIWAEEMRPNGTHKHEYRWIIDALDGTYNYIHSNPYFSISLALQYCDKTILSIVHSPITGESFVAEKGKGLWHNNILIRISESAKFSNALICTDWSHCHGRDSERIIKLLDSLHREVQRILTYGCGGLAAAHVATGRFDAYFNIRSHPWDHAAASLIVEEAGGCATTITGEPQIGPTYSVVVANKHIHDRLLERIRCAIT